MSRPAAILWLIILVAAMAPGPALLYVLLASGAFGSLQMLPGEAAGGANVLPQPVCALVLAIKVMLQQGNLVRMFEAVLQPRRLGFLIAFAAAALVSAFTLPRLFNGQIDVIPVAYVSGATVLQPTAANLTQSGYLIISFTTALCFSILGARRDFQQHFLMALLVGGVVLLATGIVDLIAYHAGWGGLLEPFRTASYALLTDVEAVGAKRVVGLTPEASVYGSFCVNALAALIFLRPLYPAPFRRIYVPVVIVALLAMTIACTSSSAYIGLAVLAIVYLAVLPARLASHAALDREGLGWELALIAAAGFALVAVLALAPQVLDPIAAMFDAMVWQKTASASYAERSGWTAMGVQALLDSAGLGVGLGAIRTSNWFVSILGSTGLFGGVLIFSFIAMLMLGAARSGVAGGLARGLRLSLVPYLAMLAIGGTIPDIGILAASYFGLLTAEE